MKQVARSAALDLEDLQAEALLGLCESAQRFDPTTGTAFEAFAQRRVSGAAIDALRAATPFGRKSWDEACELETSREQQVQRRGREATDVELARGLGVEESDVQRASCTWHRALSTMTAANFDEVELDSETTVEHAHPGDESHMTAIVVNQEIQKLPNSEQTILIERYFKDRTLGSLANEMGVSQARVCQREGAARTQLRALLSDGPSTSAKSPRSWSGEEKLAIETPTQAGQRRPGREPPGAWPKAG
jgi:RNA polymerase sigma factor for flagellar operon FliA